MAFPPLGNSDHVVVSVFVLIRTIFMIIWEMFRERLSLNLVLLLLLVNFVSECRLELMYISLNANFRSNLHGFELPSLLPQLIEISSFVCTSKIGLLNPK